MASLNVYLPDDLKKRMDAAGDLGWSRLAQAAFSEAIASQSIRKDQDMSAVVERLRASKKNREAEIEQEWFDLGAEWARDTAEYHEIRAVIAAENDNEIMIGYFGGSAEYESFGYREAEVELMDFFGFGFSNPNRVALHAFKRGVESVWEEVAAQVEE